MYYVFILLSFNEKQDMCVLIIQKYKVWPIPVFKKSSHPYTYRVIQDDDWRAWPCKDATQNTIYKAISIPITLS
jgi:hypothetical protein